jgi:RNA recognition motif-containing protein
MGETRFFVGNVPVNTSETELQNEFKYYGVVKSVEIKKKNEDESFAFVNIEIEERLVEKCETIDLMIAIT